MTPPAGWITFLNQGWVGWATGLATAVLAAILSIAQYRRTKQFSRLRYQLGEFPLISPWRTEGLADLEVTYRGVAVPQVTSAVVGLWNDGTTTILGNAIVGSDPLRIVPSGEGLILNASIQHVSRSVTDARADIVDNTVLINFDFLDQTDGFTVQIIHSQSVGALSLEGTVRGLPRGVERYAGGTGATIILGAFLIPVLLMALGSIIFVAYLLLVGLYHAPRKGLTVIAVAILGLVANWVIGRIVDKVPARKHRGRIPSFILDGPTLQGHPFAFAEENALRAGSKADRGAIEISEQLPKT